MKGWFWQGKPWQAFRNVAIIFSFVFNFIFLIGILLAVPFLLPLLHGVARPLVGGLNDSFVTMSDAQIVRVIQVDDQMPISFTLPLSQTTVVALTAPVPLEVPARFDLPDGGGTINGRVAITLPEGLALPVSLNLNVPVNQIIPVQLSVPVNIPLQETELGAPFNDLQAIFAPLDRFLSRLPADNDDLFDRVRSLERPEGAAVGQNVPEK